MKNLSVIFLLVIFFFSLVFAAYITAFSLYFSQNRLIETTIRLSRMTFQREVKVSRISFSPFGRFRVRSFSMAVKGGFENGTLISINKIFAKVNLLKLMRRELIAEKLLADGINIKLNYENGRQFDYESFFSNVKFVFIHDGRRTGFLKKIKINNMAIQNANVDLPLGRGNVKFKNIALMSDLFESGNDFSGCISFDFEFKNRQYPASLKFVYDSISKRINISQLQCEGFLLSTDGVINLLENGKVSLDFNVSANEDFFVNVLQEITGNNYLGNVINVSSEIIENVTVSYMNENDAV